MTGPKPTKPSPSQVEIPADLTKDLDAFAARVFPDAPSRRKAAAWLLRFALNHPDTAKVAAPDPVALATRKTS